MDYVQYYVITLTKAFKNLAPIIGFLIGGYIIFFKLPFWFLRKNLQNQKQKLEEDKKSLGNGKYSEEDDKVFQNTMKLMNSHQEKSKTKTKAEKTQQNKNQKKPSNKPPSRKILSPEEIFNFTPKDSFTHVELKKRYLELIKQNHPDRVASMGQDFKKLAEKNTKEINEAYEKLKKKAS